MQDLMRYNIGARAIFSHSGGDAQHAKERAINSLRHKLAETIVINFSETQVSPVTTKITVKGFYFTEKELEEFILRIKRDG